MRAHGTKKKGMHNLPLIFIGALASMHCDRQKNVTIIEDSTVQDHSWERGWLQIAIFQLLQEVFRDQMIATKSLLEIPMLSYYVRRGQYGISEGQARGMLERLVLYIENTNLERV